MCVNRADALDVLRPYLPLGWKPALLRTAGRLYSIELAEPEEASRPHLLYCDGKKIVSSLEQQFLLDRFESEITIHVADFATTRVFVHAGVVGWRGRAIVIPGRSFTGKTTLISQLVRAGAEYYSDEYAVFDLRGRVHPYPRALQIRKPGGSRQTRFAPEILGCSVGKKPLPLGIVLATRYRAGAAFRPRQISAGRAALELLNNTVSARRATEPALVSFQQALSGATALRGVRGDAAEVVARLLAWRFTP